MYSSNEQSKQTKKKGKTEEVNRHKKLKETG